MAALFEGFKQLAPASRVSLVVGLAAIAALTLGLFFWLSRESYEVLFADLEARDAAAVVAELDKLKLDYQLAEGGSQIQVPASSVHSARLKLMGAGVPLSGGVGFEIFDNSDFGMTEFEQRINYQRALEGELTRTIMSLDEVKYARVHLVMPERGLFQKQDEPPSASVALFLHQNTRPDARQILGIQRLVAAGVPGLQAAQVTVSDQNGATMSREIVAEEGVEAISGRLRQKQAVERYLVEKVSRVLEQSFGQRQILVSIDATLDFAQVKRTREDVISADGTMGGGVLRLRETKTSATSELNEGRGATTTDVEYQLGRSVEQTVDLPGAIARLSVGVIVPPDTPKERREEIRELIAMTVGLDRGRGDAIGVYAMNGAAVEAAGGLAPQHALATAQPAQPAGEPLPPPAGENHQAGRGAVLWPIALAIAAVIALLLMLRGMRRQHVVHDQLRAPMPLSEPERQRTLQLLRDWLDTDSSASGNGAG